MPENIAAVREHRQKRFEYVEQSFGQRCFTLIANGHFIGYRLQIIVEQFDQRIQYVGPLLQQRLVHVTIRPNDLPFGWKDIHGLHTKSVHWPHIWRTWKSGTHHQVPAVLLDNKPAIL